MATIQNNTNIESLLGLATGIDTKESLEKPTSEYGPTSTVKLENIFTDISTSTSRQFYIDRAKELTKYVNPFLFRDLADNASTEGKSLPQSVTSTGFNDLCNKVTLALNPPNIPFFKIPLSMETLAEIDAKMEAQPEEAKATRLKLENTGIQTTLLIQGLIEKYDHRAAYSKAAELILGTGNALLYFSFTTGKMRVYSLHSYAIERDAYGDWTRLIVQESIHKSKLPVSISSLLEPKTLENKDVKNITVYTLVERYMEDDVPMFRIVQQPQGGNGTTEPQDKVFKICPYVPACINLANDEHYGRSYIEMLRGDMIRITRVAGASLKAQDIDNKIIIGIKPGSTTASRINDFRRAIMSPNAMEVVLADANNDVAPVNFARKASLDYMFQVEEMLTKRLGERFLSNMNAVRDAERVTREEVLMVAREIDKKMFGAYSAIASQIQSTIVQLMLEFVRYRVFNDNEVFDEFMNKIDVKIITGIGGLEKDIELQQLDEYIARVSQIGVSPSVNIQEYAERIAVIMGIRDAKSLIKQPQQQQAEQFQQALADNTGSLISAGVQNPEMAAQAIQAYAS